MEVVACIFLMALSHHVCFANLGVTFALFALATSLSFSLALSFAFRGGSVRG
jgi:hypothetical protein